DRELHLPLARHVLREVLVRAEGTANYFFSLRPASSAWMPALATSTSCSPVPPPTPTAPITSPSTVTGTPPFRAVTLAPLASAACWRPRLRSKSGVTPAGI